MKKVEKLIRKSSKWENIKEHTFINRNYHVNEDGVFFKNGQPLKINPDKRNLLTVFLIDDNNQRVRFKLHQVVIQTFMPNENISLLSVDHINRDRLDNRLCNLRYADYKTQFMNRENIKYKNKKVLCNENKTVYESAKIAEIKLGITKNTVARVARGQRKQTCGYTFKFV